MHLSFNVQLKGYWLGFFAWLVLTWAPVATALTQTEVGYFRLCSATGAHWISAQVNNTDTNQNVCTCLASVIPATENVLVENNSRALYESNLAIISRPFEVNRTAQPRAPPFLN